MVVAVIGAAVLVAAISVVLSSLRVTGRMAALRHLQDHCGWVQFLINHEIEQAESASTTTAGELNLTVPGFTNKPTIIYRLNTDTHRLLRTGPGIDLQGRLMASSEPVSDLVARDVEAFDVTVTNPRSPRYRLTIKDTGGNTYTLTQDDGRNGGAYCRARDIN
ncbi:MAG: hypothetical protein ACKO0M_16020 [Cyanobium sp.]